MTPSPTIDSQGRRILYFDASSLKDSACLRKFYWSTIKGFQPAKESKDCKIAYGSAFHLALQSFYAGDGLKVALQRALDYYSPYVMFLSEDDFRTIPHLVEAVKSYYGRYIAIGPDGLKALPECLELKWAFPYWQNDQFVVILCGTIDFLGTYYGQDVIVDHKTTAAYRVDQFFSGYSMDIQPMLYTWMDNHINQRGDVYLPVMINGIFLKKPTQKAANGGVFDGVQFERSPLIEYTKEQMEQFDGWLKCKINSITQQLGDGESLLVNQPELAFCRTPFGLCKYFNVCSNPRGAKLFDEILSANYTPNYYDPLSWRD